MKGIFNRPQEKVSRPSISTAPDQPSDDIADDDDSTDAPCGADEPGQTEKGGPDVEVLMPDIYGEKREATEPPLKIPDPTSPDIDVSNGFDPYDTVVLHEKQGVKKG
jgi:hypothetical protein